MGNAQSRNAARRPTQEAASESTEVSQAVQQFGFTKLVPGGPNCNLDIVFLHGLRGHPIDTWSDGQVCWPRDLLKDDVKNARIVSWGYDSSIANLKFSNSSQASVFGNAQNLLDQLWSLRGSTPNRPIIWVGHSLGGLVIKDAIILANDHDKNDGFREFSEIFTSTIGVIFLGTPHRGSGLESLGQVVAKIAKAAWKQPNSELLRTLSTDSHVLEKQRDQFDRVSKDLEIVCFAEQLPWLTFGLIVDKTSAHPDGRDIRKPSIHANHMNMVKFADKSSTGYLQVVSHINRIHNDLLPKLDPALNSLWFDSIDLRISSIKPPNQSTLSWIFESFIFSRNSPRAGSNLVPEPAESFASWLRGAHEQTFWISGKAGSGKSTLMMSLYNDVNLQEHLKVWSEGQEVLLCGFFATELGRDPLQKSREGMLRSVLYRLIDAKRELAEVAYPSVRHLAGPPGALPSEFLTWDGLKAALNNVLNHAQGKGWKVCMFVDGLDECRNDSKADNNFDQDFMDSLDCENETDDSHWRARNWVEKNCREIVDYLVDVLSQRRGLKLCVSSREIAIFEEDFAAFPRIRMHEHTQSDIRAYCLDTLSSRILGDGRERLVKTIVQQSGGVFLWVELVIKEINAMRRQNYGMDKIMQALDDCPKRLQGGDGLYMRMMKNITQTPEYLLESSRVLRLVQEASHWNNLDAGVALYALQHFEGNGINVDKVKDMKVALDSFPVDANFEAREEFRQRIMVHFGGLLECEAPHYRVEFVHKTAKDFALCHSTWLQIYPGPNYDSEFDAALALLAGHVMFVKALGRKMIDNQGEHFGSSYVWAADAMHYAELADSSCQNRESYIGLVDELDRTMATIAKQIKPCQCPHFTGKRRRLQWPHYEPTHREEWWQKMTGMGASWNHRPPLYRTIRIHDFLALAALGNLVNYVEQKLSNAKDRQTRSRELLTRVITFPLDHHSLILDSKWTKAESIRRYTPIGCRLVNEPMMKLLIMHARITDGWLDWDALMRLGSFCFSDRLNLQRNSLAAEMGVVDHEPVIRQDRVRWIAMLRLLVQEYQSS
ncbi:hypothetical protein QBC44DRAFT_388270, partial [Cladorrhinum sp. PSN332]